MELETTLRVGAHKLTVFAAIPGFCPDAERVKPHLEAQPNQIALAIPPEDLEGLATLHDEPDTPIPDPDPHSELLFSYLAEWGECKIPSADLAAIFAHAKETNTRISAVDLDDETHSQHYIRLVKFRHAVGNGRTLKKLLKKPFPRHPDPYALAIAWDQAQTDRPALRAVEELREEAMATGIYTIAQEGDTFAWVPVARYAEVVRRLEQFLS